MFHLTPFILESVGNDDAGFVASMLHSVIAKVKKQSRNGQRDFFRAREWRREGTKKGKAHAFLCFFIKFWTKITDKI